MVAFLYVYIISSLADSLSYVPQRADFYEQGIEGPARSASTDVINPFHGEVAHFVLFAKQVGIEQRVRRRQKFWIARF